MNTSASSPRSVLAARARKHRLAIAAAGVMLTGGVTAYAAAPGNPTDATDPTATGTGSESASTSQGTSTGSGLTAADNGSSSDGSSNAS